MKKLTYVSGALAVMLWVLGALFKMLHWPGANELLIAAAMLFLIFIPAGAWYRYHKRG